MFWGGVLGSVTVAGCTDAVCLPFVVATVTGRGWPSALRIQSVGFVCGLGRTLHWYTEQRDAGVLCEYSDGAHLHRDFRQAAGGIPPSVFRQVGRLMKGHAVHTSALALKVHDHVDKQTD